MNATAFSSSCIKGWNGPVNSSAKGLSTLFASHGDLSADFWDELEELFIMADMGVEAATELCKRLKSRARAASATTPEELRPLLAAELEDIFRIPRRVGRGQTRPRSF